VFLGLALIALFLGFSIAAARRGLLRGGDYTYRTVAGGIGDLFSTSPRRVWALARLAIKEAWRRRVVIALAVFLLILLFANWFLNPDTQEPARLYLSFVLTASTYLVLGIALILSAFSLPGDFKSKTIYTVVTKPVHASEIILGRIIGFTLVATALLAVMAVCSYIFVVRSLNHTHEVVAESLVNVQDSSGKTIGKDGRTSKDAGHSHDIKLDADGTGYAEMANGHTHNIDPSPDGNGYKVSPPIGFIRARVPQYGKLRFVDRTGAAKNSGISVGNEWTYRSFIDGNTPATAIWTFENVSPAIDGDPSHGEADKVLPLALTVRVFRTHKGVIGQAIQGQIQFRRPADPNKPDEPELISDPLPLEAKDQQVDEKDIPRKLTTPSGAEIDLFNDLVNEKGQIEVLVKCLERGQYYGFAQADCYLRHPDGSPIASLAKVFTSIWVQAVIVIAVGVTISTLVSGPVAVLFTAGFIILGFYRADFMNIAVGKSYGGGPAESIVRIANQSNVMVKLDEGFLTTFVTGFDRFVSRPLMWSVAQCLPDFSAFSTVRYAADGYNVPWDRVFQDVTTCLGYVVALSVLGYFLLRTREVAA
jgi:ABC-type transport system involved in multi-copper enzyme maturation permease subunit